MTVQSIQAQPERSSGSKPATHILCCTGGSVAVAILGIVTRVTSYKLCEQNREVPALVCYTKHLEYPAYLLAGILAIPAITFIVAQIVSYYKRNTDYKVLSSV